MRIAKSTIVLFLLPALFIYALVFLYPSVRSVWMSFYEVPALTSAPREWKFKGWDNYVSLYHNSYFMTSAGNVLKIWLLGGLIVFVCGMFFAVLLSSNGLRGKGFWKSLIYLPNTVSAVVMSVVWLQYVYNPDYGMLATLFRKLGLTSLANFQWTADSHLFMSMLIAYCFGSVGYFMLILSAGIGRIPQDFYEAAILEGSGPFHRFFRLTLPLLNDVFRTAMVLWTATAINFFVWSATFGQLSPETITPGYYMYTKVFGVFTSVYQEDSFNVGAGAAVGVLITLTILLLSAVINLILRRERLEF